MGETERERVKELLQTERKCNASATGTLLLRSKPSCSLLF